MKTKLLSIVILNFCVIFSSYSQITFENTYGGPDDEYAEFIIQDDSDDGYVFVGLTRSYGLGNSDLFISKCDNEGNQIWFKNYGGESYDKANCVKKTSDNGFILAGLSAGTPTQMYIVKTDHLGDSVWTKKYGETSYSEGNYLLECDDNGFIIAGNSGSNHYIVRTNNNGDSIWTKTYDTQGSFQSIKRTNDNGFILTGDIGDYSVSSYNDLYIMKTDIYGDTLWTKTFGLAYSSIGNDIIETVDNCYVITGYTNYFDWGTGALYLIKIDNNGNLIWEHSYGIGGSCGGESLKQTDDNGYIVAGYNGYYSFDSGNVFLLKTDSFGDTLWTQQYGGLLADKSNCIESTNDNGFIMCGSYQTGTYPNPTNHEAYLIKIMGNTSGDIINLSKHFNNIYIYPNPTSDLVHITINDGKFDEFKIEIIDVEGRILYNKEICNNKQTISVSNFPAGTYFVEVISPESTSVQKLIIE